MTVDVNALQKRIDNLAAGLRAPGRSEEAIRHYEALVGAMNNSHTEGEQDALTVFEAVSMLLGQLTANMGAKEREGLFYFVLYRAEQHSIDFAASGKGARHYEEPAPGGPRQ